MMNSSFLRIVRSRYALLIALLGIMVYIHVNIIQIHPLIFLVWPISLWLFIEIYSKWRNDTFKIVLVTGNFVFYLMVTQLLVIENAGGIFFDKGKFPNLAAASSFVLLEALMLFLYDAFLLRKVSFKDIYPYLGFSSVIPWLSPAIIEGIILFRWFIEGTFESRTIGKGLGAASLNDILFIYGYRNFLYSSVVFYTSLAMFNVLRIFVARRKKNLEKKVRSEKDRQWLISAWENPLSLLTKMEQDYFFESYGHLDEKKRNELLRSQVLPNKGIRLVDPDSVK